MSPTESNRVQQSDSPDGQNAPARVAGSQCCPGYALRVSSQLKKRATACFSGAENSKTSKRVSVGRLVLKKKSECVEPASLLWDSHEVWCARHREIWAVGKGVLKRRRGRFLIMASSAPTVRYATLASKLLASIFPGVRSQLDECGASPMASQAGVGVAFLGPARLRAFLLLWLELPTTR